MRIFLIQPKGVARFETPPLGLQMMAAILKRHGLANIVDVDPNRGDDPDSLDYRGDRIIVGLSVTFMTVSEALRLARVVKAQNPAALVVCGGPQPTLMPEESLRDPHVDVVVLGEGFVTMLELALRVRDGGSLAEVAGLWFKDAAGATRRNAPREFLRDLDVVPWNERSFFNEHTYHSGFRRLYMKLIGTTWNVMASQSCPYSCRMCQPALRTIAGPWRQRSVASVIAEIRTLKQRYGARLINFSDNDLGIDRQWLRDFCREARRIDGISMTCCGRANLLDRDLLSRMREAGFHFISFGAESGSDRVLREIMNKKTTVRDIVRTAHDCYDLDIRANAFWMLANPGETVAEMHETIRLSSELPLYYSHFHIATPNPGTRYYFDAVAGEYLNMGSWDDLNDRSQPTIIKPNVTRQQIADVDRLLMETMIGRGWNCHLNGHTLSFHNTRLFLSREPIRIIGREILNFVDDRRPYHIRNVARGAVNALRRRRAAPPRA